MRRSNCSKALALAALVALLPATPSAVRAATPDDRAAVDRGRTAGREMLMLRDPRVFGIALLHARSLADVDAFLAGRDDKDFAGVPGAGQHPASGLKAFVDSGERNGFDAALNRFNDLVATPAMWSSDARSAALYDAGIEVVVVAAAGGNPMQERLSVNPVIDLANHVGRIPDGVLGVDLAPIRAGVAQPDAPGSRPPPSVAAFARDLAAAADAIAPAANMAPLGFTDGPAGDAALGVAASTVAELLDSPLWLMQPDAQRFIDVYAARLLVLAPTARERIGAYRRQLRGGPEFARGPAAHDAALQAHNALLGAIVQADRPRAMPIVMGSLAAQLVYNAAILRDSGMSAAWLRLLATSEVLDAGVPGWAQARGAGSAIAPSDWNAQFRFGLRLVELIAKGGPR